MIDSGRRGRLEVLVLASRREMGRRAAEDIEGEVVARLGTQEGIRMVFAAAPSQNEVLAALAESARIDWRRVTAFHMDEYVGLGPDAPQAFGRFLRERIFDRLPFRAVHLLDGRAPDPAAECDRYAALLGEAPLDLVVLGIGENGHLAFNDPHVADFDDPAAVKAVELDEACRQQQVNDGCFTALEQVPSSALTLTIPTLLGATRLFCVVPGRTKSEAVGRTLHEAIGPACPATILRNHERCTLYLDQESSGAGSGW